MASDEPTAEPSMRSRAVEWAAQLLVFYSIVCYYSETEMGHSAVPGDNGSFWQWNERLIGVLFTLEYLYRWVTARNRLRYPLSVMAIIDAVAVLPFYLGLVVDLRALKLIRTLRVLRVFKLYRYNTALQNVMLGFRQVKDELAVVGFVVVIVIMVSAEAMYEFEHDAQPEKFARLSDSVWWSFVTLTTVGYGDVVPSTVGGRLIAMVTMILGIGIFGTFISLIGGSFLTTMREQDRHQHHHHHHHLSVSTAASADDPRETVPWLDTAPERDIAETDETVPAGEPDRLTRTPRPHWQQAG